MVIGIGTRYSDFTSASRTAFNNPDVRFVNINVASLDSVKQGGVSVVSDAREALEALGTALDNYSVEAEYRSRVNELAAEWEQTVSDVYAGLRERESTIVMLTPRTSTTSATTSECVAPR